MTQTIILSSPKNRDLARRLIGLAPDGAVMRIKPEGRSLDQNSLLWAAISDVSRAMPGGKKHTPETWKCLFMSACGHAVQFEEGLDGKPFPIGFRSSKLTVSQMGDLLDFIFAWGAENGVVFTERRDAA
jgi:hypothetical protein